MSFVRVVRVNGVSMSPALDDGDFVLVVGPRGWVRAGAIALVVHPTLGPILKRVVARDANGSMTLAGENALSSVTADLGSVPLTSVIGRAWLRIGKRSGVRWLPALRSIERPS